MGQWARTWEGFKASSEIVSLFPGQSETPLQSNVSEIWTQAVVGRYDANIYSN